MRPLTQKDIQTRVISNDPKYDLKFLSPKINVSTILGAKQGLKKELDRMLRADLPKYYSKNTRAAIKVCLNRIDEWFDIE